jgi:hypothetical protein
LLRAGGVDRPLRTNWLIVGMDAIRPFLGLGSMMACPRVPKRKGEAKRTRLSGLVSPARWHSLFGP